MSKISLLPTLQPSQGLKTLFFAMKFYSRSHIYVDNMCTKFQVQKIHPQKDTSNLPTCILKLAIVLYKNTMVDFEYFFVGESFELDIWHIFC